jgi:predicted peroxiredoxin
MEKENEIPYRKLVLDYFEGEIYNEWTPSAEFEVYETTTADGYAIYVAKSQEDEEVISENVFYYDHELPEIVKDAIENGVNMSIDDELANDIYLDEIFEEILADNYEDILDGLKDQLSEENESAENELGNLIELIEKEYE